MKKNAVLLCLCISLIGCTSAPKVDIQAEADAIRNMEDQWNIALQNSEPEKIIGYYANDAVIMSSNKPIIIGLEAIRNMIDTMFADTTVLFKTFTGTVDFIEVSSAGDLAYARGHQEITIKTKDGNIQDKGKWVDVWKKIDGQWKVTVSVGNSDMPAAGQ
jgi:uncharacterized protein (TIGR02246 family)